jgi:hypothetical protein
MTLPRLCSRLAKLEARWRPWVAADVLRRARQCAPSELGAFLLAELLGRDRATAAAIMDQLTEAEGAALDALIGPELFAFLEMLPASELEAITRGDPIALQRSWRAFQRWRNDRP